MNEQQGGIVKDLSCIPYIEDDVVVVPLSVLKQRKDCEPEIVVNTVQIQTNIMDRIMEEASSLWRKDNE